jgi:hypothetical protein
VVFRSVNGRRADNTMAKRKRKGETMIYKSKTENSC